MTIPLNTPGDVYGIVANVVSDHVLRHGAKVWLCYCLGVEYPVVVGMSKGGRIVQKVTNFKRLTHFRAVWIPVHLRSRITWIWENKDEATVFAAQLAQVWAGVQFFTCDGTRLAQDGITLNEALTRYAQMPDLRIPR